MRKKKSASAVELTCCECGTKGTFPASSPAAPELTASEASAKEGWSYAVGFFAMLTGDHQNRCPTCTRKERGGAQGDPAEAAL